MKFIHEGLFFICVVENKDVLKCENKDHFIPLNFNRIPNDPASILKLAWAACVVEICKAFSNCDFK